MIVARLIQDRVGLGFRTDSSDHTWVASVKENNLYRLEQGYFIPENRQKNKINLPTSTEREKSNGWAFRGKITRLE